MSYTIFWENKMLPADIISTHAKIRMKTGQFGCTNLSYTLNSFMPNRLLYHTALWTSPLAIERVSG